MIFTVWYFTAVLTLGAFLRKSKMIDPTEADAMKEFHKTQGLCTGPECDHIVHRVGPLINDSSYLSCDLLPIYTDHVNGTYLILI